VAVDKNDRPEQDIRILRATIVKNPFAPAPKPAKKKQISRKKQKK
jgi:peptidyl-prolyl cis-trans isomerase B (cyclophilin B)